MKVMNAFRGTYRNKERQGWVRVAAENCIIDIDVRFLGKVRQLKVSNGGEVKESWFQPILFEGKRYWASCATGSLFNADGSHSSPQLRIINL